MNPYYTKIIFLNFYLLSNLHPQYGAQTQNPEIQSPMLHWQSQPGVPTLKLLLTENRVCAHTWQAISIL